MWSFVKEKELIKLIDTSQEVKIAQEEWTPFPGYEKYYVTNNKGKLKSLGNEFDFHIDSGISEDKAAFYTMNYIKGFLGKDSPQAHNIDKVIEVMKKNLFKKT